MLKKALQAEEVSIDVQGVRERVLRINRLPVVVKDGDELGAEICARWLIGQFSPHDALNPFNFLANCRPRLNQIGKQVWAWQQIHLH